MSLRVTTLQGLEQAEKVSRLFAEVHGEGYPVEFYYQPQQLWDSNQAGHTISAVATDDEGAVVGHCALFGSAPNPRLLKMGAGLVQSSARRTDCLGLLTDELLRQARERDLCDWVFSEAVCNQVTFQKTSDRAGFTATAVEVDRMPASGKDEEGRVSTLLCFLPIKDSRANLLLPRRYRGILEEIYETLGVERHFDTASEEEEPAEPGVCSVLRNAQAGLLRLTVQTIGLDLPEQLRQEAAVMQLILPLDSPYLDFAVVEARDAGFFIAGLLPAWSATDALLLQRLAAPPDWDRIALQSDFAKQLLEVIKVDTEAVALRWQQNAGPVDPVDA